MTNEEILEAFIRPETFPAEAIALAGERRDQITPLLVAEIEAWGQGRHGAIEGTYYLADIACHLLAEWRDPRGFKPMLALLDSPDHEILGDSITESVASLLARLFDGDLAALQSLIRNRNADEYVRDAALDAYVLLAEEGQVPRAEAHSFLSAFFDAEPHTENFVWNGWINAVASLQFEDFIPLARQLFDEEAIDISWLEFEDFRADFDEARTAKEPTWQIAYRSPIREMQSWRYGSDAEDDDNAGASGHRFLDKPVAEPAVNPFRDVGRNDPCPCGSGKKFKKCCLAAAEAGEL